jgi:hypothetical protein
MCVYTIFLVALIGTHAQAPVGGGMIAYFLTDCALGTGCGHFVPIDSYLRIDGIGNSTVTSRWACGPPITLRCQMVVGINRYK